MISWFSDMKFRQRCAWLSLAVYLLLTGLGIYYMFEINEAYNVYALDHIRQFHTKNEDNQKPAGSLYHITDIPRPAILLLILTVYMQGFCFLLACTKQEPRAYIAFAWPFSLYMKLKGDNHRIDNAFDRTLSTVIVNTPSPTTVY